MKAACLTVLLLTVHGARAHAQRAGLWDAQVSVDGVRTGVPVEECRIAGAQIAALQAWPASCIAQPLRVAGSTMVTEARCSGGRTSTTLSVRRELTGDLDRRFVVVTSSGVDGATAATQARHRSTVTFRYLGACAPARPRGAGGAQVVSDAPRSIAWGWIAAPVALLFGSTVMVVWFLRRRWRDRLDRLADATITPDAAGMTTVPVLATFTGIRGLPWWYAVATNNASPLFVLEPDGLAFRVIRQQRRRFAAIRCVDVRQAAGTVNIDVTFRDSIFTFAANVGSVALAAQVIALLPQDVPLSSRARALMPPRDVTVPGPPPRRV